MGNEYPPLKRHESLQPFSRDHFIALRLARDLSAAALGDEATALNARQGFLAAWRLEIEAHFDEEERWLSPLMRPEETERMRGEHSRLRRLAVQEVVPEKEGELKNWCAVVGRELHDHVRWEERVLFGAIQQRATPEQLQAVGRATAEIESRRPGCRKRGPGPRKGKTPAPVACCRGSSGDS